MKNNNETDIEIFTIGKFDKYTVFCKKDDMRNSLIPYVHVSNNKDFDAAISIYNNQYIYTISKDILPYNVCNKFNEFMGSINPYLQEIIATKRTYWDLALLAWMFANDNFEYDNIIRYKPDYSIIL